MSSAAHHADFRIFGPAKPRPSSGGDEQAWPSQTHHRRDVWVGPLSNRPIAGCHSRAVGQPPHRCDGAKDVSAPIRVELVAPMIESWTLSHALRLDRPITGRMSGKPWTDLGPRSLLCSRSSGLAVSVGMPPIRGSSAA
jgi:hypothetical protein